MGPDLHPSTVRGVGRSVGRALFGEAEEIVPKRLSMSTAGYAWEALERWTPGSTSALSLHHLFRVKRDGGVPRSWGHWSLDKLVSDPT